MKITEAIVVGGGTRTQVDLDDRLLFYFPLTREEARDMGHAVDADQSLLVTVRKTPGDSSGDK